jgi:nitric oxide reductase NorE protein
VTAVDDISEVASEDAADGHIPGQPDMWFFVLFESLVFTTYFAVYLYYRAQHEDVFLAGQAHLNLPLGVADTIVLLTSSWSIARCVQNARAGHFGIAQRDAIITGAFGFVFLVLKVVEWVRQVSAGRTISSSNFFEHYYFLTGIHAIHLLIGFVALGVVLYQLASPKRRSQELIETCATYWHTVDFLWVVIFAMLYVVR